MGLGQYDSLVPLILSPLCFFYYYLNLWDYKKNDDSHQEQLLQAVLRSSVSTSHSPPRHGLHSPNTFLVWQYRDTYPGSICGANGGGQGAGQQGEAGRRAGDLLLGSSWAVHCVCRAAHSSHRHTHRPRRCEAGRSRLGGTVVVLMCYPVISVFLS